MFNAEKGFGFIHAEDGHDVFFHWTALDMEGYKTTKQGDQVEFEEEQSDRGPRAKSVKIIATAE